MKTLRPVGRLVSTFEGKVLTLPIAILEGLDARSYAKLAFGSD